MQAPPSSRRKRNFSFSKAPALSRQVTTPMVRTMIKREINKDKEMKHSDVNSIGVAISSSPSFYNISQVAEGDTNQTREGTTIKPQYLACRWQAEAADAYNVVRMIGFQWYGNTPPTSSANVLQTAGGSDVYSYYSIGAPGAKLFRIIFDQILDVQTGNNGSIMKQTAAFKSLKGYKQIHYFGPNGGDYSDGSIWILFLSDSGAITHPSIRFSARLAYKE